jgi:hypothetical protein
MHARTLELHWISKLGWAQDGVHHAAQLLQGSDLDSGKPKLAIPHPVVSCSGGLCVCSRHVVCVALMRLLLTFCLPSWLSACLPVCLPVCVSVPAVCVSPNRSWSTPSPSGRGPRGRTALGRPPDPAAAAAADASWGQFPRPAGPICLLEPCVLLTNVPWHLKQQDLQQQLPAAEVWILDTQPPVGPGSSSSRGARACCVLKAPL